MTTRHFILDLGRCLRASAPPLLTLGVLTLARTAIAGSPMSAAVDEIFLVAWRAAMIGTLLWFLVALVWAASRPLRDRRAFQRLQHLREIAGDPDRALVHVQTIVWSSSAGQHVVVRNVAAGVASRIWLSETTVPIGSFLVLERTDGGVRAIEWMNTHQVGAGHRHEARRIRPTAGGAQRPEHPKDLQLHDAAAELVRETEQFLRSQ